MNKSIRKAVIAGNWKMNKTPAQAKELLTAMIPAVKDADCEVIACVPYVDLQIAMDTVKGSNIKIGAENCHWAESGAFTGEVSANMLKEMGVEYVIIGHSERRQYFGETDLTVNQRVKAALTSGLKVILCVGELKDERELDITNEIIGMQVKIDLKDITADDMKNIIIAYEPVWAIGTGLTATSDQAEEVCKFIRDLLASLYSKEIAQATTIQYGGSMNAGNAEDLLSKEDVDGGLIGGASLVAEKFAPIVEAASK